MARAWSDDTPERLAESLARENTPDEILGLLERFVEGEVGAVPRPYMSVLNGLRTRHRPRTALPPQRGRRVR